MTSDLPAPFLSAPETAGLFLDFDGTLSEIVHLPWDARPVEGVRELLGTIASRFALVAIVSGRSAHQLLEWLGPQVEIWGVHGAERTIDGSVVLSDRAGPFADLMRQVKTEAEAAVADLDLPGVVIEDKGVMVGLHFRAADDVEAARMALDGVAQRLASRHGLLRAGGRLAFELRPPIEFSKAAVVLDRSRELGLHAAAFVGDDRVDLPGFDALDILAGEGVVTLRVAVDSDEAPPELITRADVVLRGPPAVREWLASLTG
ncbi:MAG: trehalose 6-phosphate phosphatase [Actinomycetota bacterium]|jgi:trehalose 6-phosphate phosphatase|nr:trehalose 6-phosphate phosphatase [Actinomycetota bacterium]